MPCLYGEAHQLCVYGNVLPWWSCYRVYVYGNALFPSGIGVRGDSYVDG